MDSDSEHLQHDLAEKNVLVVKQAGPTWTYFERSCSLVSGEI